MNQDTKDGKVELQLDGETYKRAFLAALKAGIGVDELVEKSLDSFLSKQGY